MISLRNEKRELPVLWYQCFLTFAQRYKQDISSDQKQALLEICKVRDTLKVFSAPFEI